MYIYVYIYDIYIYIYIIKLFPSLKKCSISCTIEFQVLKVSCKLLYNLQLDNYSIN